MTGGWTWLDWMRLATGIGLVLYGLYRLRHADFFQRRAQERRDARGVGVSRYAFAEPAPSQRADGWWLVAFGLLWTLLAVLP